MDNNQSVPLALRPPFRLRKGASLAPRLLVAAGLSLLGGQQALADSAITLPPEGDLSVDFRCIPQDEAPSLCPIEDGILSINDSAKYLNFHALENNECSYPPNLANNTDGAGVFSSCDEDGSGIDAFNNQELRIDVVEFTDERVPSTIGVAEPDYQAFNELAPFLDPSSALIDGIYLSRLNNSDADGCFSLDSGVVEVTYADDTTESIPFSADDSEGEGGCLAPSTHEIFVEFTGSEPVVSILVTPSNGSLLAAGVELPDVSPENCEGNGANNESCKIQVGDPDLDGGELFAVITDSELTGNVEVVAGPYRVVDDRAHCQPGASGALTPVPLTFDDVKTFTYLLDGVLITDTLPLVVSDNTPDPIDYFTISEKGCGVPRMAIDGPPVERSDPGWTPYIDIVGIATDIVPEANVLGFESGGLDGTPYECDDVLAGDDASLLTQPLLELNARDDEIKILSGVPGIIDPIARDITVDCGSKRGRFKAFSFVAWNLIHATQTDISAETGDEIQVLVDSGLRYGACVDPSFYYSLIAPNSSYIQTYYNYAVMLADMGYPFYADYYLDIALLYIDQYINNLDLPGGKAGFERCFASGDKLELIKDSSVEAVVPGDLPLNAWGDLVSQLEHLRYVIRTFKDELIAP